jgi:LuxR family maltose regulon positive regulatory protein
MSASTRDTQTLTLVRTKLHRPRIADDLVQRPHLLERLNHGLERKLTLISAPAGYGKTTLAVAWLQNSPRPVAWLSIDADDSDLQVFLNYFVAAIQTIYPDACPQTQSVWQLSQLPPLDTIATTVINEIADLPEAFILVLDDYHAVQDDTVNHLLGKLLDHLPTPMHLVIVCRTDPLIPVSRLRVSQQLTEIRAPELRFGLEEAQIYLESALRIDLSQGIIALLQERTEGWIAGLRLAAVSMRGIDDPAAFAKTFKGTHANVVDYLVDEVLSRQPPAVQDFLLQTSLLDRFCAQLCGAVTGKPADNCQETIAWLEKRNLFVVPLDYERRWYRYHHLFQELLLNRLRSHASDEEIAALHDRASIWLGDEGFIGEALRHALAAANVVGAVHVVEQHRHDLLNNEDWRTLERWLDLLPDEVKRERPALLVARAWVLRFQFKLEAMLSMLQAAERRLDDAKSEAEELSLRGEIDAMRSNHWIVERNDAQKGLECAERALNHLPYSLAFARGLALDSKCLAFQTMGRTDLAVHMLKDAIKDPRYHTASKIQAYIALCFIYQASGDLPQLLETAHEYLEMATDSKQTFGVAWASYFAGIVRYDRNELDAAVRHFSNVIRLRYGVSFYVVKSNLLGLAVVHQARGEPDKAQETIELLDAHYRDLGNIEPLPEMRSMQARLSLYQGDLAAASGWVHTVNPEDLNEPIFVFEVQFLTWAAVRIAQGTTASLQEATNHLQRRLIEAEGRHNTRRVIRILVLLGLAYEKQGQTNKALEALERAVVLAQPGGFIRTFVDLGPTMAGLLHQLAERGVTPDNMGDYAPDDIADYVGRMLAAFPETTQNVQAELVEPLTARELEVLGLLGRYLTYKEIADTLIISPRTAKKHVSNIYHKLGVNKRKQALDRSKELGLLPSD